MGKRIVSNLTFANVVSVLALFVALGGTTYAVTQLNGSKIVNRSVPGEKLKKNTLTGTEINESKLKTVRSAEVSDRTLQLIVSEPNQKKAVAQTLRAEAEGDSTLLKLSVGQTQELLTSGPFALAAACVDQNGTPRMRVTATTTEAGSYVNGANRLQPFGPGEEVVLFDVNDPFPGAALNGHGIATTFVAPSGATLQLGGPIIFGTEIFGADCVVSANGVG